VRAAALPLKNASHNEAGSASAAMLEDTLSPFGATPCNSGEGDFHIVPNMVLKFRCAVERGGEEYRSQVEPPLFLCCRG